MSKNRNQGSRQHGGNQPTKSAEPTASAPATDEKVAELEERIEAVEAKIEDGGDQAGEGDKNDAPAEQDGDKTDGGDQGGGEGDQQVVETENTDGDKGAEGDKGEAASVAQAQSPALRTDTKIAGRSAKATEAAVKASVAVLTAMHDHGVTPLTSAAQDSVRAAAKGTMYAAPGAFMVGLGNTDASSKAPQHQLAVAAVKALGGTKTSLVDLHAVQRKYAEMGGTDLSIFTGRTRIYTNSSKSAKVAGVAQAPLTVYLSPPVAKAEAPKAPAEVPAAETEQSKVA